LLELLEQRNAPATFFLKTDNLDDAHPDYAANRLRVQKIHAAGHEICNHTHSHRRLTQLDDAEVREEMLMAENQIASETGRRTQCMRPPYTDYDDRVLGILGELGYRVILWSFDSGDWLHASTEFPNDFDTDKVLSAVTDATKSFTGPLIHIQHDNEYTEASVELVPLVIDRLRNGGWQVITMSECVGGPIDKP
jgi:peptidoglycan/xylan/chitin deacetylase (PgdA/CDA1 family)